MTAAVTRELSIVYGTLTIGGTTDRLIDGKWRYERAYEIASVECEFVTTAATEGAFATEVAAVETAFATPRARLRVVQGSETLIDFDPSTNSGYNARPAIIKAGDIADTGRSRRYRVRVEVDMPADLSGQNGRRESRVDVSESPSGRRTLGLSGVYTALGGNSARTQYENSIDAYVTTLTTALGGTWELTEEVAAAADDADKLLEFARVYRELIFAQSSAATDDATIIGQRLFITRTKIAPGDAAGSGAQRLIELAVSYEASIVKTTTDLKSKWDSGIRPYVLQKIRDTAGTSSIAITSEDPRFDFDENRITATLRVLARSGSGVLQKAIVVENDNTEGVIPIPVWDGGSHTRYMLDGPATFVRTITTRTREVGGTPLAGGGGNNSQNQEVDFFGGASLLGGIQSGLSKAMGIFGIGSVTKDMIGKINISTPGGGSWGGGGSSGGGGSGDDDEGQYYPIRTVSRREPIDIGPPDNRITVTDTTTIETLLRYSVPRAKGGTATGPRNDVDPKTSV